MKEWNGRQRERERERVEYLMGSVHFTSLLSQPISISTFIHSFLALASIDITVGFLMQIDKLVQLLESPVFLGLRLLLLTPPSADPSTSHLLITLYGLLMVLPQSNAYRTLNERLQTVSHLHSQLHPSLLTLPPPSGGSGARGGGGLTPSSSSGGSFFFDIEELKVHFLGVRERHIQYRQDLLAGKSLLNADGDGTGDSSGGGGGEGKESVDQGQGQGQGQEGVDEGGDGDGLGQE